MKLQFSQIKYIVSIFLHNYVQQIKLICKTQEILENRLMPLKHLIHLLHLHTYNIRGPGISIETKP